MKIGFFIEPKRQVYNKITSWKKKFYKAYGNQQYLNHPPHLTLCTMQLNKIFLLYVNRNKTLKIKIPNKNKIKIKITKSSYFENDPLTNNLILFYKVEKNTKLEKIQELILKKFKKFKMSKIKRSIFQNEIYNKNYIKYTYPFIGNNFIPHFTITSINKNKNIPLIKKFLKQKIDCNQFVKNIIIYNIKKDKHDKIGEILIE